MEPDIRIHLKPNRDRSEGELKEKEELYNRWQEFPQPDYLPNLVKSDPKMFSQIKLK